MAESIAPVISRCFDKDSLKG